MATIPYSNIEEQQGRDWTSDNYLARIAYLLAQSAGGASEATAAAILAAVEDLLAVAATEAKQDDIITALDQIFLAMASASNQSTIIARLDSILSTHATALKQDTANSTLASIDADQSTAANQLTTHGKLDSIIAALAGLATEAKQDAQITELQTIVTNTADTVTAINGLSIGGGSSLGPADVDAFGRRRVSSPTTLADLQFTYNKGPLDWYESTSGVASATHDSDSSTIQLAVGATVGDTVIRQTQRYFRYRPGKSQLINATGVLGAAKTGVTRRIGYFDDYDGLFFELNDSTLYVVLRSQTSGAVVDTAVPQSLWNIDKLDGLGDSGYNIDTEKAQIFFIDFEWLGVGRVRMGVVTSSGEIVYCHSFDNANVVTTTYMSSGNLPVRYELFNNANTAGATNDMRQICSTVISEGGADVPAGTPRSAHTSLSTLPSAQNGVLRSMVAIRPKFTFFGKPNRGEIIPTGGVITQASAGELYYEIVLNPTIGLGSWTDNGTNSLVEYSLVNSTYTGGEVIGSGYLAATSRAYAANDAILNSLVYLTNNIDLTDRDVLVIAVMGLGRTVDINVELSWKETY